MTFTEEAQFSSLKNLFYINHHSHIKLYDKIIGFLGNFEVWHDSSNENKEYITLNLEKRYIESIEEH